MLVPFLLAVGSLRSALPFEPFAGTKEVADFVRPCDGQSFPWCDHTKPMAERVSLLVANLTQDEKKARSRTRTHVQPQCADARARPTHRCSAQLTDTATCNHARCNMRMHQRQVLFVNGAGAVPRIGWPAYNW